MERADVVLAARGLTKTYRFDSVVVEALRGVDLENNILFPRALQLAKSHRPH